MAFYHFILVASRQTFNQQTLIITLYLLYQTLFDKIRYSGPEKSEISGRGRARTREILKIGDADGRGRANLKNSGTRTDADSQNRASRTTLVTYTREAL